MSIAKSILEEVRHNSTETAVVSVHPDGLSDYIELEVTYKIIPGDPGDRDTPPVADEYEVYSATTVDNVYNDDDELIIPRGKAIGLTAKLREQITSELENAEF